MKQLPLTVAALLALSFAMFAQGGPVKVTAQGAPSAAQIEALTASMGPTHSSHLVKNPAGCAPDYADPVWGPGNALVGYSCYTNANGN